ncbi:MAG TPA: hypothetical protein VEZ12_04535 [Herpetosiphonaceae bacterium]|nr:hypothetical protein [Herpetosiphonaceae bacterium]
MTVHGRAVRTPRGNKRAPPSGTEGLGGAVAVGGTGVKVGAAVEVGTGVTLGRSVAVALG